MMMRLHLVSPFYTKLQQKYSYCSFTSKALLFSKMMQKYGYEVIEYSNCGSESSANEHVVILNDEEYDRLYPEFDENSIVYNNAIIGSDAHQLFQKKLIEELSIRLRENDIICYSLGECYETLINIFPNNFHVEIGVGYLTPMKNSLKIYESYSWMHYNLGKNMQEDGANYQWVVPKCYDIEDWTPNYDHGKYISFLGRIIDKKGISTLKEIASRVKYPIIVHGQGNSSLLEHPNIHYLGPISGKRRNEFLRKSRALIVPSTYIEPFCSVCVESALCGTPVITVDYGGVVEIVEDGMGFKCHTLQDWLSAIENVESLDRKYISDRSRSKYNLNTCGEKYDKIFKQINDLRKGGWYELNEYIS